MITVVILIILIKKTLTINGIIEPELLSWNNTTQQNKNIALVMGATAYSGWDLIAVALSDMVTTGKVTTIIEKIDDDINKYEFNIKENTVNQVGYWKYKLTFDNSNNLISFETKEGLHKFEYENGKVKTMTGPGFDNGESTITFDTDQNGRIIKSVDYIYFPGAGSNTDVESFKYNSSGLLTQRSYNTYADINDGRQYNSDLLVVNYNYDKNGYLTGIDQTTIINQQI